ncbi:MAG: 3-oxoacyl-[acyl-carrier-protein] reductase FabG [Anaerolineae bacterium]|nr:3-oxoacyl-[acyl-carrier-protein] reductase FabG [Anaerolineae bacterium]
MQQLTEQVALVTGAGRGIGRSIALALAGEGARVALVARTEAQLHAVQAEIEARGGQALSLPADVSDEAAVKALVRAAVQKFGRLDIVVNNAAIGVFGPLAETRADDWDRVMAVNVRGPFLLCREAIPYLKQQPRSFIINMNSVVGVKGYVNQALYGASKHALLGLTKVLAKEVQADGIRVHAICPGGVDTEFIGDARPDLDRSLLMQADEIADAVLFLVTRRGNAVIDEIHLHRAASTPWA